MAPAWFGEGGGWGKLDDCSVEKIGGGSCSVPHSYLSRGRIGGRSPSRCQDHGEYRDSAAFCGVGGLAERTFFHRAWPPNPPLIVLQAVKNGKASKMARLRVLPRLAAKGAIPRPQSRSDAVAELNPNIASPKTFPLHPFSYLPSQSRTRLHSPFTQTPCS